MRVALGADENAELITEIGRYLEEHGHELLRFGAASGESASWGRAALAVADAVANKEADFGVVCCWTGTGVSIAANKVAGVRSALCTDAETARGARKWNDANVLALGVRGTSKAIACEILSAWLAEPYGKSDDESLGAIGERERQSSAELSRSSAR